MDTVRPYRRRASQRFDIRHALGLGSQHEESPLQSRRHHGPLASVPIATVVASSAQAVPPTRESEPPSNFDSSLFCAPLRVESLRKNVKTTTFSDGRQLTRQRDSASHEPSSGKSLVITDAGNLRTQSEQTMETFHGRTLLFFPRRTVRARCLVVHRSAGCHLRHTGWLPLLGPRCHREQADLCARSRSRSPRKGLPPTRPRVGSC